MILYQLITTSSVIPSLRKFGDTDSNDDGELYPGWVDDDLKSGKEEDGFDHFPDAFRRDMDDCWVLSGFLLDVDGLLNDEGTLEDLNVLCIFCPVHLELTGSNRKRLSYNERAEKH